MDSFELNKILGAVLGTCLILLSLNIAAGAIFSPPKLAKPGYEIAVQEAPSAGEAGGGRARRAGADRGPAGQRHGRARRHGREEMRGLPYLREGRPNRVGPNLWGIVGRPKASHAGLQLFGRHEGPDRQLDDRRPQQIPAQPQGHGPGHQHEFRRPAARQRARRHHRLPEFAGRQPGPAAEGGRGPKPAEAPKP